MSTLTDAGSTPAVTDDGMAADVLANVACSPQEADDYRSASLPPPWGSSW